MKITGYPANDKLIWCGINLILEMQAVARVLDPFDDGTTADWHAYHS